jgi:hypothetical protein
MGVDAELVERASGVNETFTGCSDSTLLGIFIGHVRIADGNESEKKGTDFITFERLVRCLDEREAHLSLPAIRPAYIRAQVAD